MEENDINLNINLNPINKKKSITNSKFSKNIKDLFSTEYVQFYDKNRLSTKLKSIISKEKFLNNRKIKDFNYSKMFHFFKVDMRKFEDEQNKKKTFYKTLKEENLKFNQDYKKNYSSKIPSNNMNNADTNIKSKTFQKFYNKHRMNLEQNSKKINNFFNRDPLLYSKNDIDLFYLNKDIDEDYLYNNEDEALNYVNKLEQNINEKSVLNKIKNILDRKKSKKEKKLNLNSEEENSEDEFKNSVSENKFSNQFYNKGNTITNMKRYNKYVQKEIQKLNSVNNNNMTSNKNKSLNKIYNLKQESNINYNNKLNEFSRKRSKKIESNQIENLYNEIIRIKKNLKQFEKKNAKELKYLYTAYSKNKGKKLKLSLNENQTLFNLDRKLVYTVNSFND